MVTHSPHGGKTLYRQVSTSTPHSDRHVSFALDDYDDEHGKSPAERLAAAKSACRILVESSEDDSARTLSLDGEDDAHDDDDGELRGGDAEDGTELTRLGDRRATRGHQHHDGAFDDDDDPRRNLACAHTGGRRVGVTVGRDGALGLV